MTKRTKRSRGDAGKGPIQLPREGLAREFGGDPEAVLQHDLDDLAGVWEEDPELDRAIAEQDRVDEALWR